MPRYEVRADIPMLTDPKEWTHAAQLMQQVTGCVCTHDRAFRFLVEAPDAQDAAREVSRSITALLRGTGGAGTDWDPETVAVEDLWPRIDVVSRVDTAA
jgi:hypothetical protein